jgi:adenylate cyclase
MMKKIIFIVILVGVIFTGCAKKTIEYESIANHVDLVEESEYGSISLEFSELDGENIRSFKSKKRKEYKFDYEYLITEGSLTIEFRDSKDNIIETFVLDESEYVDALESLKKDPGETVTLHEIGSFISVKSSDSRIKIALIGEKAKGKIKIVW